MKNTGIKLEKVNAWLEIDVPINGRTPTTVYISKFSATFGKNMVPQATCSLAAGSWVNDPSYISTLHGVINQFDYRVKARVYAQITPVFFEKDPKLKISEDPVINGKPFIVFEGYASGAGYRRGGNAIEYVISLEHFASDLAGSSCLSPDIHPGVPISSTFQYINGVPSAQNQQLQYLSLMNWFFFDKINLVTATDDAWKNGLEIAFRALAKRNELAIGNGVDKVVVGTNDAAEQALYKATENASALAALDRFIYTDPYYKPFKYKSSMATVSTKFIQAALNLLRSQTLLNIDNGSTLWDQIIIQGANMMYDIVPVTSGILVVPKFPNNKNVWKTIFSSEIETFDISTGMPRFTKAVVLKVAASSSSSGLPEIAGNWTNGIYSVDGREGLVLIQQAPPWAVELTALADAPPNGKVNNVPPTNRNKDEEMARQLSQQKTARNTAMDAYAKLVYSNEVLKYRGGNVVGKLRFDIAPGSMVKLETNSADGPALNAAFDIPIYGCVDQVGIFLDADTATAATTFTLSSVRNEKENNDSSIAFSENPFYDNTWVGAPLVI